MKGIDHYELLSSRDGQELSKKVNQRLDEGWELYASPFSQKGHVFQAVVRIGLDEKRIRKTSVD